MSRAKGNLTIPLNENYLDNITAENWKIVEGRQNHLPPSILAMHLTHDDVNLGYFEFVQHRLNGMISGDLITVTDEGYADTNGDLVLKFSNKFIKVLNSQERKGKKKSKLFCLNYI